MTKRSREVFEDADQGTWSTNVLCQHSKNTRPRGDVYCQHLDVLRVRMDCAMIFDLCIGCQNVV